MAACCHCSLSLYYPPQVIADAITCSPQRGHGHCRSATMSMPIFIVSSPVEIASRFPLPPEGADFLEHCAFTIPTVSALPNFVRPLNLQLSISLLCRLTLAIVLSPGNYPRDNFLPPEGG